MTRERDDMRDVLETPRDEGPATVGGMLLLIRQDIRAMKKDIDDLKEAMETKYVTQDQFWPVKTIVYGGAGIVLVAVVVAIVALVVKERDGQRSELDKPLRTSSYADGAGR